MEAKPVNLGGRPPGSKSRTKLAEERARKILFSKDGTDYTTEEVTIHRLLCSKSDDIVLRTLTLLKSYADGKPTDKLEHSGEVKGGTQVIVLPDKKPLGDWMKDHGQEDIVEVNPDKGKIN